MLELLTKILASGTVEIFTHWLCTPAITFTFTYAIYVAPLYNTLLDYLQCAEKHTRSPIRL